MSLKFLRFSALFCLVISLFSGPAVSPAPGVAAWWLTAAGDFNADGLVDVAVASADRRSVRVLLNDGEGGVREGPAIELETEVLSMATGDVDGDGAVDLVVGVPGAVLLFVGDGRGGLRRGGAFTGKVYPVSMVVGDFGGGGARDVAMVDAAGGVVRLLIDDGSGGLRESGSVSVGLAPVALAAGDFDGDGRMDLSVVNALSHDVSILLGNGDGTFRDGGRYGVGNTPRALVVGDFNGDGRPDLAVANYAGRSVSVLLGSGGGRFGPAVHYAAGDGPVQLAVGDFDGDGKMDVAVGNVSGARVVLRGSGDGTFREGIRELYHGTVWLARPDVVIQTAPASATVKLTSSANPSIYGQAVTLTAAVTPSAATGKVTFFDGTTVLGVATIAAGQAQLTTILLAAGARSLAAYYGGDTDNGPGVSPAMAQTVNAKAGQGWSGAGLLAAGLNPICVAVGDFDGDGNADLVMVNNGSNNVRVMLGDGSGGFTLADKSPFTVGMTPSSIVVGDFDGDGNMDLAVANSGDNNVSVWLGDGTGVFQAAMGSPIAVGTGPKSLAVGDFNGDGNADLAVANGGSNNVTVLLGDGSGGFKAATASPFTTGTGPASVAVGDFNLDGKADLAIANNGSKNVTVLLGDGSGGFKAVTGTAPTAGTGPMSVVVGDFNGDGKPDMAVANSGSNSVTVLLGTGTGAFKAATGSPFATGVGTTPNAVAVGDLNGDGKPDLVSANYGTNTVTVLLGTATGTFTAASGGPFATGANPVAVALGDFNGDGKADLAVANWTANSVSVLLGSVATTTTLAAPTPSPAPFGVMVTMNATVTPATVPGAVAFYDGTTLLGVAALSGGQAQFSSTLAAGARSLRAYYAGSPGYMGSTSAVVPLAVNARAGNGFATGTTVPAGSNPISVVVADFNGDGHADLAVANAGNKTVTVLLGNGSAGFTAAAGSPFAAGTNPTALAVGDFNGDGKVDIAVANGNGGVTVLLGDGSGGFATAPGSPFAAGSGPDFIVTADFNGDGKADLAVCNQNGNSVTVLLGNGTGGFAAGPGSPVAVGATPNSIAVADFNKDGFVDLAVANSAGATLLLGNGAGGFTVGAGSPFPAGSSPTAMTAADFNGDGKVDMLVANQNSNSVTVLLAKAGGGFGTGTAITMPVGNWPSAAVGDFNGDGKADLAVANWTGGSVNVLLGNGSGGFTAMTGSPLTAGASPASVAVGDFNGDGMADLAVANYSSGSVTILLGQGPPPVPSQLKFTVQPGNGSGGTALSPAVVVQVQDKSGFLATASSAAVTVTSTPAGVTATANAVSGAATFSNLVFGTLGTYKITATSTGLTPATSSTFTIAGAPSAVIDAPAAGASVTAGAVVVSGWAMDNITSAGTAISVVKVAVDGTVVGNATYGGSRADICTSYPARPGCPNIGFTYSVNLTAGSHTITVSATDSDGVPDTGSASVTVTVQGPMTGDRVGVFRKGKAFLVDSDGSEAYEAGKDRYVTGFAGPGGFVAGDIPVVGDWTGDGHAKVGIYRSATGQWFLDANDDGAYDAATDLTYSFGGVAGDIPFVGDWAGVAGVSVNKTCVGVLRSAFLWVLDLNCNGTFDGIPADASFPFGGLAGDVPVVGNWSGGSTRVGVVRKYAPGGVPQGNPFYWVLDASNANAGSLASNHQPDFARSFAFGGLTGDVFLAGDWNHIGAATAGVYRGGFWVLDAAQPGAPQASHAPGLAFGYGGIGGDVPLAGKW